MTLLYGSVRSAVLSSYLHIEAVTVATARLNSYQPAVSSYFPKHERRTVLPFSVRDQDLYISIDMATREFLTRLRFIIREEGVNSSTDAASREADNDCYLIIGRRPQ